MKETDVHDFLSYFDSVKSKFSPRDIFNLDEAGVFFNMIPERTYNIKGQNCHGGEKSKQRVTVVLICNADGSEKLRPWIIGKFKNPRCFKNIDMSLLPCD